MKNISNLSQTTTSLINSSCVNQIITKLSGDNITAIVITVIVVGTICNVCSKGGSLEITYEDKKVVLNGCEKAA